MAGEELRDGTPRERRLDETQPVPHVGTIAGETSEKRTQLRVPRPVRVDADALGRLLDALAELSAQLIFTALTPTTLAAAPGYPVFHVERGDVRAL